MNKKQYNNVIEYTLKHDQSAQTEDSLATARAIFNNMGVSLPNGTMQDVYETISSNEYMGWRSCTMQEAQEAADNGIAAIGISEDRVVVLSATDEEEPVAQTASVMTFDENTSAYAVDGLTYYSYRCGTTTQSYKQVTVISCSPGAWISSSAIMGYNMSVAMGADNNYEVKCPSNADEFKACWSRAVNCVVIHTHGSQDELCDENAASGETPTIISTNELEEMPRNYAIHFVMVTACQTASGNEEDNVAYWLSKKINPNGIVIANKYVVSGDDTSFNGVLGETPVPGWMVYKNGVSESLPATTLTMESAYQVFEEYN